MTNRLLTADEAIQSFLATINKSAETLPPESRAEFKVACFEWIGGALFQGPVTVPNDALRYV